MSLLTPLRTFATRSVVMRRCIDLHQVNARERIMSRNRYGASGR